MDIHKPKPWHGWREFLKEYGIIVLGVLTAITLEQTVEQLHWRAEVRKAHDALWSEMAHADKSFAFRARAQSCIDKRLDSLQYVIEQVAKREKAPQLKSVNPVAGNALSDNEWEIAKAAQTLGHFDEHELSDLSSYYIQLGNIRTLISQEGSYWATLDVLKGDPNRLGPTDITELRVAVQNARWVNFLISVIAREELVRSEKFHVPVQATDEIRLRDVCRPFAQLTVN